MILQTKEVLSLVVDLMKVTCKRTKRQKWKSLHVHLKWNWTLYNSFKRRYQTETYDGIKFINRSTQMNIWTCKISHISLDVNVVRNSSSEGKSWFVHLYIHGAVSNYRQYPPPEDSSVFAVYRMDLSYKRKKMGTHRFLKVEFPLNITPSPTHKREMVPNSEVVSDVDPHLW